MFVLAQHPPKSLEWISNKKTNKQLNAAHLPKLSSKSLTTLWVTCHKESNHQSRVSRVNVSENMSETCHRRCHLVRFVELCLRRKKQNRRVQLCSLLCNEFIRVWMFEWCWQIRNYTKSSLKKAKKVKWQKMRCITEIPAVRAYSSHSMLYPLIYH